MPGIPLLYLEEPPPPSHGPPRRAPAGVWLFTLHASQKSCLEDIPSMKQHHLEMPSPSAKFVPCMLPRGSRCSSRTNQHGEATGRRQCKVPQSLICGSGVVPGSRGESTSQERKGWGRLRWLMDECPMDAPTGGKITRDHSTQTKMVVG